MKKEAFMKISDEILAQNCGKNDGKKDFIWIK